MGVLWRGDFETGNLKQYNGVQAAKPERIHVVQSPVWQGKYACSFTILADDPPVLGSDISQRSQLSNEVPKKVFNEGDEFWYQFAVRFPSGYKPQGTNAGWNAIAAFHNTGAHGQANVDWKTPYGKGVEMWVQSGADPMKPDIKVFPALPTVPKDQWLVFVHHIKWSTSPAKGFVEAWCNGKQYCKKQALANLYPGQGTYWKLGLYRRKAGWPISMYGDAGLRSDTPIPPGGIKAS